MEKVCCCSEKLNIGNTAKVGKNLNPSQRGKNYRPAVLCGILKQKPKLL